MDSNKDGVIQPDEVPAERRGMLQFFASRMGIDPSQPIPISRVREAVANRPPDGSPGGPGSSKPPEKPPEQQGGDKAKKAAEPPLVPGFGVEQVLPPVVAFGDRAPGDLFASSAAPAVDSQTRGFAEERFKRYDRNGSGVLEKEEWGEMRGDPASMDSNQDGRLTLEEYAAGVANYVRSRGGSPGGASGGGPGGPGGFGGPGGGFGGPGRTSDGAQSTERAGTSESNDRKSYRFVSPSQRLPEGLPSWFAERDRSGDGQISMAEYASSWSDASARDFAKQDLNGDGVITPSECLRAAAGAVSSEPGSAASNVSAPSSGSSPTPSAGSGSGGSSDSTPWWMR